MDYLTESAIMAETKMALEPQRSLILTKKKEHYSDIIGNNIVDARTGAKYPWKVGSFDERRFFIVTNTVPFHNFERKGTYDNYSRRSSCKAFYESPYAYMKHCNVELDEDFVKAWYEKKNKLYLGMYNYPGGI